MCIKRSPWEKCFRCEVLNYPANRAGWRIEKRFLKITILNILFFEIRKLTMQKHLHPYLPEI